MRNACTERAPTIVANGAPKESIHRLAVVEGMAECMDMAREDLIRAGIISHTVPPMMVAEAVLSHISKVRRAAITEAANFVRVREVMLSEGDHYGALMRLASEVPG